MSPGSLAMSLDRCAKSPCLLSSVVGIFAQEKGDWGGGEERGLMRTLCNMVT